MQNVRGPVVYHDNGSSDVLLKVLFQADNRLNVLDIQF